MQPGRPHCHLEARCRQHGGMADVAGSAPAPSISVTVTSVAGSELARLTQEEGSSAAQLRRSLVEAAGSDFAGCRLLHGQEILRSACTLAEGGIVDGSVVIAVRCILPAFQLCSSNMELRQDGLQAHAGELGCWATALVGPDVDELTLRFGPMGTLEQNNTDYFLGAIPEADFHPESQDPLSTGGRQAALILSEHSRFSGFQQVADEGCVYAKDPQYATVGRKFHEGDVLTVRIDRPEAVLHFAIGGVWIEPPLALPSGVDAGAMRLGVSIFCGDDLGAGNPARFVEVCASDAALQS